MSSALYRGRIAPTPTGYLHLGHARTFWIAQQRCSDAGGALVLRNEDLDSQRCKPEYVKAMYEDLRWFGLEWDEGPDAAGPFAPYSQSERRDHYLDAWKKLLQAGLLYPCSCTRKDLEQAVTAPHEDDEPIYPGTCSDLPVDSSIDSPAGLNWRFRVPPGVAVAFRDRGQGEQIYEAGKDFGDFLVWRRDDMPSYQLAVVVDDSAMWITEVVRGADLLKSTARQILLYKAMGLRAPRFYHAPLMLDEGGQRLAKRHDALSLRKLREMGKTPEELRAGWDAALPSEI
jgi:glutamyl/glutaminyl-tRNA synthetase